MKPLKSAPILAMTIACVLVLAVCASAKTDLKMRCRVVVPKEYGKTPFSPPPNGESEPVRYTVAYEAFWWNCVAVRAADLDRRCPSMASGTPAASAGAADGAMNADSQIDALLQKHEARKVLKYLRTILVSSEAKQKMRPYFLKPKTEAVN